MTTPTSVPGPATEPVYRSRKEAREARLAAEKASVSTVVDSVDTAPKPATVEVAVVDDLAGAGILSRTARRQQREEQARIRRQSRYVSLPLAASLSLMLVCLPGLAVADHLMEPTPKHSAITSAVAPPLPEPAVAVEPAVTPSPVAPAPPVEAPKAEPAVLPAEESIVTKRLNYNESYGTVKTKFDEVPRDLRETDYLNDNYKNPEKSSTPSTEAERLERLNAVVDMLDGTGRHFFGHYARSEMFGQPGVVGLAGERGAGAKGSLTRITEFQRGDEVVIETNAGTYVYSYLWQTPELDLKDERILWAPYAPVYRTGDAQGNAIKDGQPVERALVFTTCGLFTSGWKAGDGNDDFRIAAYFEQTGFTPRA